MSNLPRGIHPLMGREVLEGPSPKPYLERPDANLPNGFPDLDTLDPLYIPRYLVRRWGWDVFAGSAYYHDWAMEAERVARKHESDLRPAGKKK